MARIAHLGRSVAVSVDQHAEGTHLQEQKLLPVAALLKKKKM